MFRLFAPVGVCASVKVVVCTAFRDEGLGRLFAFVAFGLCRFGLWSRGRDGDGFRGERACRFRPWKERPHAGLPSWLV